MGLIARRLTKKLDKILQRMSVSVDALIIGAGPAGLAMSACLFKKNIDYIVIEKSDCIAPLWQYGTYDALVLQRLKRYCQLPHLPFPENSPDYPTKEDFIKYLKEYANKFNIKPQFNECVKSASYDEEDDRWMVVTEKKDGDFVLEKKYICKVVVVATGRDAEPVEPDDIKGLNDFRGEKFHSRDYKNGAEYKGKTVLVIGSGDSATDILLDLTRHGAKPFMVVRNNLIEEFPEKIKACDLSKMQMNFGEFQMGDPRGEIEINVFPEIKKFNSNSVSLVKGGTRKIDCVVMATGYRSDVNSWLQEPIFFDEHGVRNEQVTSSAMVKARLCVIGFKKAGILAIYRDAPW